MTVINVILTINSLEALSAMTLILIASYRRAFAVVQAWVWVAVLHLQFAVSASIARRTVALKALTRITTVSTVKTWLARTCYRLSLAMLSNPTVTTLACVAIIKAAGIISTCAIIQTWIYAAVFNFNFTVGAEESGWTLACVGSLASVGTGSAVMTRLVIGAEVQVLIAEQSTPALLADAFPFHRAGSMYTSWIHFTLVTIRSPVSALASVDGRR